MTIPYTYLIGWPELGKWYYGSRTAKNCSPDDLWSSYFTSSKLVKDYRKKFGEPSILQIRRIFDTPKRARLWEAKVLTRLGAAQSEKWLNGHNGDGKFICLEHTNKTKQKISIGGKGKNKGQKRPKLSEFWKSLAGSERRKEMHKKSATTLREKMNNGWIHPNTGKFHSEETKQTLRTKAKQRKQYSTYEEKFNPERVEEIKKKQSQKAKSRFKITRPDGSWFWGHHN